MSEHVSTALAATLDSSDRETGFIDFLPPDTQQELLQKLGATLSRDSAELDQAVGKALTAMPAWLRPFASAYLK